MANSFKVRNIQSDLFDLSSSLEAVDMESVKIETIRRSAHAMAEMVRQAVVAEDKIKAPANFHSEYDGGPGPSMAHRNAWNVIKTGNTYEVRPHPEVKQRAIVLNYGYPGEITPNTADVLKFNINGVPVFAESVSGPEYTGYWQAAERRFRASGKLERIAAAELREEFEEKI